MSELAMTELKRQYDYMERLRSVFSTHQNETGEPYRYFIVTLGCQMNAHDSEKVRGILEYAGALPADAENQADLVLYNTCCVRENAELRVFGRLGYLKGVKKKRPGMKIALCGCMMQEPHIIEKIKKSYPEVDLIFGTYNFYKIAELLYECITSGKRVVELWSEHGEIIEDLPSRREKGFKASVNIGFGCDNFCSYCIVPYVRGRERSRCPEDIIKEVRRRVEDGAVEIELLGQNVNSYGIRPAGTEMPSFAELLKMVSEVEGVRRIRFMSSHPKDLSDELIETMGRLPKLCPHFHLPLQSGSDRLLKLMNRHYTKDQYLELVRKLRAVRPDMAITTDIIVGFPKETEEDFEETLDVVRKCHFASAFTFIYSPRVGTPAAEMPDQVPAEVSSARFDRLLKLLAEVQYADNQAFIGQTVEVLAEEYSKNDPSMLSGRTPSGHLVHFTAPGKAPGDFANVLIESAEAYYIIGKEIN